MTAAAGDVNTAEGAGPGAPPVPAALNPGRSDDEKVACGVVSKPLEDGGAPRGSSHTDGGSLGVAGTGKSRKAFIFNREGMEQQAGGGYPHAVGMNPQTVGMNPQAVGMNPQAVGMAPQAVGMNPQTVGMALQMLEAAPGGGFSRTRTIRKPTTDH